MVSPLTVDDMREVHLIVGALEGIAAAFAARLAGKARETLTKRMAALNAIMTQATTAHPPKSLPRKTHICCFTACMLTQQPGRGFGPSLALFALKPSGTSTCTHLR